MTVFEPSVGIFWFVPTATGESQIIFDRTPLAKADPYGDMMTHEGGHSEFWDHLAELGAVQLRARGISTIPARFEYDIFPRGRVVFDTRNECFVIYADRRLCKPSYLKVIERIFGLADHTSRVSTDLHYSRSRAVGVPVS